MRILALVILLAGLGSAQPAFAQSEADGIAIRSAIGAQLDAFNRDDSSAAYGFAAPNVKALFPTPQVFMQMVQLGYAPIYRSRSRVFAGLDDVAGTLTQRVFITDVAGEGWLALYTVAKQPDGRWKITGCSLARRPGESV